MTALNSLEGMVVAVAGAGGGLGPHVVRALASRGASVAAADREGDRAETCVAGVEGGRCQAFAVDLLDPAGAQSWAGEVSETFGGCDALVHLVGGWRGGQGIDAFPLDDADWLHNLLVRTLMHASRALLPALKRSGRGRLLLMSSPAAERPDAANAAYGASKAAAEAFALAVGDELTDHGGTANIVRVKAIVTPEMREANPDKDYATFTDAGDIAEVLAWLLEPPASAMRGQRVALHG